VTSRNIDWVWDFMIWMSVLTALGVFVAIFHFTTKYRAKSRVANELADKSAEHNTTLEITWSVLPLFVCIALFVWGFKGFVDLRTPPKDAMELHANAQKWKWTFDYKCPTGGMTDDTLHVPIDRPVRMLISSVDVLHALYIPSFRTKMDAVPGRYTDLWFQATKAGDYPIFCAEYCGTRHSGMVGQIHVMEPDDYQAWLSGGGLTGSLSARGEQLFQQLACNTCHLPDGSGRGPVLAGVFGSQVKLEGGRTIVADESYLRESILTPQMKIVQGYGPLMPTFQGLVNEEGLISLIEYVKSLPANRAAGAQQANATAPAEQGAQK
jgi:cytochrome c oxidase subunit 2